MTTRKHYSQGFKARVAVGAIRGEKTLSQLGSEFKVHPIQIAKWRKSAIEQLPELFVDGRTKKGTAARGRCMDNIFIERLWRSLKYEEVYLKDYASVSEARAAIEKYFSFQ